MDLESFSRSATSPLQSRAAAATDRDLAQLTIREGEVADLSRMMELVTQELSLGRRHLAYAAITEAVQRIETDPIRSIVAIRDGRVVAAAIATRIANDAAQFLGVGCDDSVQAARRGELSQTLVDRLHHRLVGQGYRFAQVSCDADEADPACGAVGYEWIATLDYLDAPVRVLRMQGGDDRKAEGVNAWAAAGFACRPIDPRRNERAWQRTVDLVQKTYEQTLDCPRLNRFRSAADVVGAYVSAVSFQPDGWRIVSEGDRDIACLMTVIHHDSSALELTYMGIRPSHRGRGVGKWLVREAAQIAHDKGIERIVLAVDRSNRPAWALYRRCGFEKVGCEAVWGRKLSQRIPCA